MTDLRDVEKNSFIDFDDWTQAEDKRINNIIHNALKKLDIKNWEFTLRDGSTITYREMLKIIGQKTIFGCVDKNTTELLINLFETLPQESEIAVSKVMDCIISLEKEAEKKHQILKAKQKKIEVLIRELNNVTKERDKLRMLKLEIETNKELEILRYDREKNTELVEGFQKVMTDALGTKVKWSKKNFVKGAKTLRELSKKEEDDEEEVEYEKPKYTPEEKDEALTKMAKKH